MEFSLKHIIGTSILTVGAACGILFYQSKREWWEYEREMGKWREELHEIRLQNPPYVYEKLLDQKSKTTRLIELLPATEPDNEDQKSKDIRVNLCEVSLLDPQRQAYEALSYCWGSTEDPEPVFTTHGVLWVTHNLFSALLKLRRESESRFLWVDAVCINQSDNDEKNYQVRMMGEIYQNAERVLAWLGGEADNSELLERFVPQLLKASKLKKAAGDTRPYYMLGKDVKTYGIPSFHHQLQSYLALHSVVQRDWFQRIWIVQELVLAKEALLLCGDWVIPWDSLKNAWKFIGDDLTLDFGLNSLYGQNGGQSIQALIYAEEERLPLLYLLVNHCQTKSSDPRDKVFAITGIASTEDADIIDIDYRKPIADVFIHTAREIIAKNRNLDVLSFSSLRPLKSNSLESHPLKLPSWVPDWRSEQVVTPLILPDNPYDFQATAMSVYSVTTSSGDLRIQLSGHEIDTIAAVGPRSRPVSSVSRFWNLLDLFNDIDTFADWARFCGAYDEKAYEPTGEMMMEAFRGVQTLGHSLGDLTEEEIAEVESYESRLRLTANLHTWLPSTTLASLVLLLIHVPSIITTLSTGQISSKRWRDQIGTVGAGRVVIKSSRGFIGMASGEIKVTDKLVLLKGGRVPLILRPTGNVHEYLLIGDAYVHGQMHGREWKPDKCETYILV